jgi:hypothetical protein
MWVPNVSWSSCGTRDHIIWLEADDADDAEDAEDAYASSELNFDRD